MPKSRETLMCIIGAGVFSFIMVALGVGLGRLVVSAQLFVHNPLLTQSESVQTAYARAASTLLNCVDLKRTPYHKTLRTVVKGSIGFAYDPNMPPTYYAHAAGITGVKNVILGAKFFTLNERARTVIVAHELLHLIKMPKHIEPIVRNKDAIYLMNDACFPFDKPSTL